MAVGAVGNGLPFSKARGARLRVHGAGSVHGLFGGVIGAPAWARRKPVESQVGRRGDRRPWGSLRGRVCHDAASDRLAAAFPRRVACSVRKLGTSNSSSTE